MSTPPLWHKDAVIYEVHVKTYADSNGDGIGDFPGLASKLDYLADLGINTLWLLPFFPSPLRDDGYDVCDFRGVHPDYGTLDDFKTFLEEAHRRGLRVMTEMPLNHTSDRHPWFERARRAPKGSSERAFYVWNDSDDRYAQARVIFCDTEHSNWTWDEQAGQFYWHRFFRHQPDLNFDHPPVFDEIADAIRFWLELGVDGIRLDAVPYLIERDGTNGENLPETHAILQRLRAQISKDFPGRVFLAEANQWPNDVRAYFGSNGTPECHMAYHFPLMPRLFLALAEQDSRPVRRVLENTPDIPADCSWAVFLRNHDELTLEMVDDRERAALYERYARIPGSKLNVGIRRRLAPLLDDDPRRLKLLHGILLSLPGAPIIYYGDEIAMGDRLDLNDRDPVRTPMQWDSSANGGFSSAPAEKLVLPPVSDPIFGFKVRNVEGEKADPGSFWNWLRAVLALRRESPALTRGAFNLLPCDNDAVLTWKKSLENETIFGAANLSERAQAASFRLPGAVPASRAWNPDGPPLRVEKGTARVDLPPLGFAWFRNPSG